MWPCLTLQELMQFRTTGGKLKKCELTLHWPEEMTFIATASKRVTAEKMAAALACLKLKVRIILGKLHYAFANVLGRSLHMYRVTWSRSWSCWIKTTTR